VSLAGISNHEDLPAGSTSIFAKATGNKGLHSSREMKMFVYNLMMLCYVFISLLVLVLFTLHFGLAMFMKHHGTRL